MERILMELEVQRANTLAKLNELFRERTQKKEELEWAETEIQVFRGKMQGMEIAQGVIKEIMKTDALDKAKDERMAKLISDGVAVKPTKDKGTNIADDKFVSVVGDNVIKASEHKGASDAKLPLEDIPYGGEFGSRGKA